MGWKRIGCSRRSKRVSEEGNSGSLACGRAREKQTGVAEEWRLSVELQIILALQNVVEHSESTTKTGFAVSGDIPRKANARRPVLCVWEIYTSRRAGISWIHQSRRCIRKHLRLQSRYDREGTSLGIFLWAVVFVPYAQIQRKSFRQTPLILKKTVIRLAANVRGGGRRLKVRLRSPDD